METKFVAMDSDDEVDEVILDLDSLREELVISTLLPRDMVFVWHNRPSEGSNIFLEESVRSEI